MRSPEQEGQDPNKAATSGLKKRGAAASLGGSPSKKQQKKPAKKDRRRVSFAPDPELTLVHHFDKDEDFISLAGGGLGGSVLGNMLQSVQEQTPTLQQQQQQAGEGAYRPGFWDKTVPEGSPMGEVMPLDSPSMVSMELTQPVAASQQQRQQQQGPGLEPETRMPGDVTAALPTLGALAEADALADAEGAGWVGSGLEPTLNLTASITAALPGLGSLVAEDEEAAEGMDLTEPAAGGPLPLPPQQLSQPSPAAAAVQAAPSPLQLAAAGSAGEPATGVRLSGGTNELAEQRAAATQLNKWGFAPGQEDTLDINLEMHGRMIMGDQTYSRLYCDNTTGDSRFDQPLGGAGDNDTADSLLLDAEEPQPQAAATVDAVAAGNSPLLLSPPPAAGAAAKEEEAGSAAAAAAGAQAGPFGRQPDWTKPAFLPPYMQAQSAASDHPALYHSPDVTNSSMNTLETRRVSVGTRRHSISSRRASMQDATGRLLADDDLDLLEDLSLPVAVPAAGAAAPSPAAQQAPGSAAPPSAAAPLSARAARARRRSSGASLLGRDTTEALLVDDVPTGEPDGPLADLKRQMRLLSQGSPGLGAQLEASPISAAAAAVSPAASALGDEIAAGEAAAPAAADAPPARTPRTAVSMGYADSHNPATRALLRSGGTTRLLRDTLQEEVEGEQEQEAPGPEPTARTNGTTRLLADVTMASAVGAKLLQRGAEGTPELGRGGSGDGLTGFSLDEFERPPELPGGRGEAAEADMQQEQLEEEEEEEEEELLADEEAFGSPAVQQPIGHQTAGYPLHGPMTHPDQIPGGPKLARTPLTAAAPSQQRSVHGTPLSHARSWRSASHHPTPTGSRLARTPGSAHMPAASYPMEVDATADQQISGGPKLARTPLGRTPGTGYGPGSAMAQHYPGSARGVQFAPGSALAARYPGSAVAAHRATGLSGTPLAVAAPPMMTFQDFTRLTEVQFLDNLRRGASINYADLQPNPVPSGLGDSYRLLAVTAPAVAELENGIRTLQQEVAARRVSAADAEALVGQVNPAAFQAAQYAEGEALDALRGDVALLKRVQRAKAVALLKDVRVQMEESRGAKLQRGLEAVQHDLSFAAANKQHLAEVAAAAQEHVAEQQQRILREGQARQEEADRRAAVAGLRTAVAEADAANEQRRQQLQAAQQRVTALREQHQAVGREREAVRSRVDALSLSVGQSQGAAALAHESSPQAVLKKLEELELLQGCLGWQLESAQEDPVGGELALRLGGVFRLQLSLSRGAATASVQLLEQPAVAGWAPGAPPSAPLPTDRAALGAALAGCAAGKEGAAFRVEGGDAARVAAAVQATAARLGRIAELVGELEGLRLAFPSLTEVACLPEQCAVRLAFINLDAEVKFGVTLGLGPAYPAGAIQYTSKIWFDGEGQVTERSIADALAAVPASPGRLRAICRALGQLARSATPKPALAEGPAFRSNWQNPLFGAGGSAACATPAAALTSA